MQFLQEMPWGLYYYSIYDELLVGNVGQDTGVF